MIVNIVTAMTFQPEKGDVLVSTNTWIEERSPFTLKYTERTYHRTGQPYVKVTTKRTSGPPGPMDRLKWSQFGASKAGEAPTTSVGAEVFFEPVQFTQPQPRPQTSTDDEWIPNGLYISEARKDGWSDAEITSIIRSNHPDKVYQQIYRKKIAAVSAKFKASVDIVSGNEEVPPASLGLKERMMLKQKQRSSQQKLSNSSTSLSARMNQRRGNPTGERDETKCTLFVENVPEDYVEADIKNHIEKFRYRRVNIVKRDGQSIGKAFIELESENEAQACLDAINGARWEYYVVNAQFSQPKTTGPFKPRQKR